MRFLENEFDTFKQGVLQSMAIVRRMVLLMMVLMMVLMMSITLKLKVTSRKFQSAC